MSGWQQLRKDLELSKCACVDARQCGSARLREEGGSRIGKKNTLVISQFFPVVSCGAVTT